MTIGNVQISGIVYPIRLIYRKRQSRGVSVSGVTKIVSFGFEETFIIIRLQKENISIAQNLYNYIRDTANYSANCLNITPDPDIDLSNGTGNIITVRYWSDDFEYVCQTGNLFDFEFIFRKEII